MVSALILVLLATFLWAAYREVERTLAAAAGERAQAVATQVVSLFESSFRQRVVDVRKAAAQPVIQQALEHAPDGDLGAATDALRSLAGSGRSIVELWTRSGERLLAVAGSEPVDSEAATRPAPSAAGVQVFAGGERIYSETIIAVQSESGEGREKAAASLPLGHLVTRRTLSLSPPDILNRLAGGATVLLGPRTGGAWTDFVAIVPAPAVDLKQPHLISEYRAADGERRIGALAEISGTPWAFWVEFRRAAVLAPANAFLTRMSIIAVFFVAVAVVLARVLMGRVTQPLFELSHAAEAIAGGDYGQRVGVARRDEIGRFATAFNRMAEHVEEGHQRLEAQVTERTRALEALRKSEAHHRAIVEVALDAIITIDTQGIVREFNPAAEKMFGYTTAETAGRALADLIVPPSLREAHRRGLTRYVATGEAHVIGRQVEMTAMRSDGTEFPVELAIAPIQSDGPVLITGVVRDITRRKLAEQQLRQAHKMEAVGRLAGGVAHDFNNLLSAILGFSTLVLSDLPDEHPARGALEQIKHAGESAASLTQQLLAFSRQQILQPGIIDINAVVLRMDSLLQRLIGEDIQLVPRLAPALGRVNADAGQIEQVVMNLAINARDAMPTGGKLTVETANVDLDDSHVARHPSARSGPHVMLAVSDTGAGMSEETQARIFEPFFTTKARGEGTGMGLATVYGIVKQSGGWIWVYSEVGHGTTFKIYLPVTSEPLAAAPPAPAPVSLRGTETILLAEDQPEVRAIAIAVLTRNGYTVLEAQSGEEAIRMARESQQPIHLLLTDVVMPSMSGRQLAERLHATHPHIRVLYASGYTDDAVVRHGVLDPGVAFIPKPFTPQSLLLKVREVLDAPEPPSSAPV